MSCGPRASWWAGGVMVVALAACEGDKPKSTETPTARVGTSVPASAPAPTTSTAAADKPAGTTRDGEWKVTAAGRGVAYEISSKGGVVKLDMGGTVFEGQPHDSGRKYTTKSGTEYLVKPIDNGFELFTQGKPTWKVEIADAGVTISAGDKKMSIAKAADILAIKQGDDLIGKVEAEDKKVKVTDAGGATTYEGDDELKAAWGVLLLKEIGQPMQRLIFTELLARGR